MAPDYVHGANIYTAIGGYEGPQLASSAYLGWGLLAVLAGGTAAFFRDRRLWFFGFLLVLCAVCSLGGAAGPVGGGPRLRPHPGRRERHQQRFMAVGFLAAAVMLAIIVDHLHAALSDWRGVARRAGRRRGGAGAHRRHVRAPPALRHAPGDPAPLVPRGGADAAARARAALLPGSVLGDPVVHVVAGGRTDQLQPGRGRRAPGCRAPRRHGARPGFNVLSSLAFGVGVPPPAGTQAQLAAVRHALVVWRVNTVVIATNPAAPPLQQGHDPAYAAAFMTAALGRLPTVEAGAWVWQHVDRDLRRPSTWGPARWEPAWRGPRGRRRVRGASLRAPTCVALHGLGNG